MKTLYTILFFMDTLALILGIYFFLKLSDARAGEITSITLLCAIIACIVLLVYIIVEFLKLPGSKRWY